MDMRCKTGDLAVVVNVSDEMLPFLGRVIVVGEFFGNCDGLRCWRSDPNTYDPRDGLLVVYADKDLKPLRDPGEDAKDETLEWLPVPEKVTA